jgi:hypothetical protein
MINNKTYSNFLDIVYNFLSTSKEKNINQILLEIKKISESFHKNNFYEILTYKDSQKDIYIFDFIALACSFFKSNTQILMELSSIDFINDFLFISKSISDLLKTFHQDDSFPKKITIQENSISIL